jgi:hypothetical protein
MNPSLIFIFPALSIPFLIKRLVNQKSEAYCGRQARKTAGWAD